MRLLLHAGTHKTGTSTIQAALDRHRSWLRDRGVLYPDARVVYGGDHAAHHPFAHDVADDPASASARVFVDHVAREARPHDVVLLSAEPIYRHVLGDAGGWWQRHRDYVAALGDLLAGHDVEVVIVLRRRDTFAESLYHERVSKGFGHSFEHLVGRLDRLLDFERQIRVFSEVFPTVRTMRYEPMAEEGLLVGFMEGLGLPVPPNEQVEWARRSVDARLSLWMASAYRDDADEELVTQRRRFAKNPVSDELFDDYGRVTLWDDRELRRRLLDSYGDHGPIEDDRAPARLTPEVERRIDDAFDRYLEAKGLAPTGRAARRPA